jgi:hypothetical protein
MAMFLGLFMNREPVGGVQFNIIFNILKAFSPWKQGMIYGQGRVTGRVLVEMGYKTCK